MQLTDAQRDALEIVCNAAAPIIPQTRSMAQALSDLEDMGLVKGLWRDCHVWRAPTSAGKKWDSKLLTTAEKHAAKKHAKAALAKARRQPDMKALSIRQPWAWLIVNGWKSVENRSWYTNFRGPVLIHAGKTITVDDYESAHDLAWKFDIDIPPKGDLDRGGVVGMATISDCVNAYGSPWFFGPWGFVLTHPKLLPFVPLKGHLGFFDVPEGFRQ